MLGLGYITQVAVLPAFAHAGENSQLTALVSGDPAKLKALAPKYKVEHTYRYEEFDRCLSSGVVDAVYIGLPNHLHRAYTEAAARAGVHVLCEKPMAVTEQDCQAMIDACVATDVKLMIAYRLHFEKANLEAVKVAQSGKLGELKLFDSIFTMTVKEGNIRLNPREQGGGTLYDIGVYCINAARAIFRAEPYEVLASVVTPKAGRFAAADSTVSAVLRFPGDRIASFTSSFDAADVSRYTIVGSKGSLTVDPAYEYAMELGHELTVGDKTSTRKFAKRDQFAPELIYFSNCILRDRAPEPSGKEGLADVRIIQALYDSSEAGEPLRLEQVHKPRRPQPAQEVSRPPVKKPRLIHTESPHPS